MQKTYKNVETRPRRTLVSLPNVTNMDDLAVMVDEELLAHMRSLEEDKNRAYEAHLDLRPWEEELAYVRREQHVRRLRREAHAEYMRSSDDEFGRLEASLPAGDFDNSAFVYAATGGKPRWN